MGVVGCGPDEQCRGRRELVEYTAPLAGGDSAQDLMTALGGDLVGTIEWRDGSGFAVVHPAPGTAGLTRRSTTTAAPCLASVSVA